MLSTVLSLYFVFTLYVHCADAVCCKVKSFPSHKAHTVALISVSLVLSRHQFTLPDHGYGASALQHGAPVYVPAFTGTHCTYPQRDGQAELTWMAGYIPRWRRSSIQVLTGPALINFVDSTNAITKFISQTANLSVVLFLSYFDEILD